MSLSRRNHGGGHSYTLDGIWAPGVTTLLGSGFPKPALVNWASKACAQEVIDSWEQLKGMAPSARQEFIRSAPNRDRDGAARRGTEVHGYAARLLVGEEVEVPEELDGHVKQYLRFVEEWNVSEVLVEQVIAKRNPRYCGTLDMVADLADQQRWLIDLKTTRSGVFAENALQLAAYRYADFYLDAVGVEQPMPEVDQCGVLWLRADGYDLYPVEAGQQQFLLFQLVARIARFADYKMRDRYGDVDPVGSPLSVPTWKETT